MKTTTYILGLVSLALLYSCSTNQDIAQLDEYDDLYYTPSAETSSDKPYDSQEFMGANSAESSYYGESPYVDESEKPSSEFDNKENNQELDEEDDDYYDPDYAARIENFGGNNNSDYVYSDAFSNNMNPRFYGSVGMNSFNGFNQTGFGFGMGMGPAMGMGFGPGMGMGNPWMGNRWCDPFFDPFCNRGWGSPGFGWNTGWRSTWAMYDPFSPWYNPYMAYNPYGYGWGSPYGYNPYYGPGVIVVDGGNGGNSRGFQNTSRNGSSSRTSRGGVVGSSSDRRGGSIQTDDGPKSNGTSETRNRAASRGSDVNRTRPARSATDTDYYNQSNSRRYAQPERANPADNRTVNDNNRVTRERQNQVSSPYTRQRERQTSTQQTPDYSRYNRSNSSNSNSTRTRSRNNNTYSSPSRSRSTSPSMSTPTRSRSTTTSPRTSSPSRSSGGGSRRR